MGTKQEAVRFYLESRTKQDEKWGDDVKTDPKEKGKYKGWTLADLKKAKNKLKGKEPFTQADKEKMAELVFAIRAKTGWKKGTGAAG